MDQSHIILHNQYVNNTSGWEEIDNKVIAEYVWIKWDGITLGSKCKTLDIAEVNSLDDIPEWDYGCDYHTQPLPGVLEVKMKPVAYFRDPFRKGNHIIVMCDTYIWSDNTFQTLVPTNTNFRAHAKKIFDACPDEEPWFGIEQEYTLFEKDGRTPLGWPRGGYPGPQGPYYCSAGTDCSFGRSVMEAHYEACLYAGIEIAGTNAEVMPGQWEYQVGPCVGVDSGDHLWMSRYLMIRVCEAQQVNVTFDPKPIPGDWNGAGCHTNYSTETMREPNGYGEIVTAIEKLGKKHLEHIQVYGTGNERRLTGAHETAPIDKFSYGVANRGASIRIPRQAEAEKCGYFEDRRPASNMDPYLVTSKIFKTTCLE